MPPPPLRGSLWDSTDAFTLAFGDSTRILGLFLVEQHNSVYFRLVSFQVALPAAFLFAFRVVSSIAIPVALPVGLLFAFPIALQVGATVVPSRRVAEVHRFDR